MPTFTQLTDLDREAMLQTIGVGSIEDLFADVPADARFPRLDLPPALSEVEVQRHVGRLAARNVTVRDWPCFLGAGAYNHASPSVVSHVMGMPQLATAYTPYQPEVSQGTLQAMFEFQSLVCDLLGMEAANASVYDGASAAGEAVLMAQRITRRERVVLSGALNPQWREVIQSYVAARGVEVATSEVALGASGALVADQVAGLVDARTACVVVMQPDAFGRVHDLAPVAAAAREAGALLVVATADPTCYALLRTPGAWGADIAVAEGQPLGLPLQFGGPWAGLMACKSRHLRQLPGRIAGQTTDHDGRRGWVLTLQAREQHIRREKATSNICTSQTLLAIGVSAYLSLLGPEGLREVARQSRAYAAYAAAEIAARTAFRVATPAPFYNELLILGPVGGEAARHHLVERQILGGVPARSLDGAYPDGLLLAFTEMNNREEIDALVQALAEVGA
ncbi:MAG: aminomethyl-transferring glycine dehydrogenase subunit GcvPA [Chloroflexi bacterium]|nr:aminomethyl-transferring glycine dehydrogenase subunit GcvPA [Chloroflexota bacterium]